MEQYCALCSKENIVIQYCTNKLTLELPAQVLDNEFEVRQPYTNKQYNTHNLELTSSLIQTT